jgi:uncharacterized FlaG/YvyC family protein
MGQVSGLALRGVSLPELQSSGTSQEERAHTQAVAAAVRVINESGIAGPDRQVTYSTDSATRALVIKVVDKQSREVLVQWPSEYALNIAQQYQKEHPKNESLL